MRTAEKKRMALYSLEMPVRVKKGSLLPLVLARKNKAGTRINYAGDIGSQFPSPTF